MEYQHCIPGTPVWAACGSYGWKPATIISTRWKGAQMVVKVSFVLKPGQSIKQGERVNGLLEPRIPRFGGKDKPRPLRERKAE